MDAFAAALAALHTDPNLSRTAIYRVGGAGGGVSVRLVWGTPRRDEDFGKTGAVVNEIQADLRLADIADPKMADTVEVDGKIYSVASPPVKDTEGLSATLTLKFKQAAA